MTWKNRTPHFLFHPPFYLSVPHAIIASSLGGEGRGSLSVLRLLFLPERLAPPTGHPAGSGRGCPRAGRWSLPGEGHASGRAGGGWTCLTTGRQGPAPSGPSHGSPSVEHDLWDPLGGDSASAWTVAISTALAQRPPRSSAISK